MLIKFKIRGNLRFLSHAETVKVFQRACVRATTKAGSHGVGSLAYSQGFNPRPKLSLPLPRSVGVEADDDLLCLRVKRATSESRIRAELSAQLPEGFELLSVNVAKTKTSFQPSAATYVFAVKWEYLNEKLKATIKRLLASESLFVNRELYLGRDTRYKIRDTKIVDVRPFLKSIELCDRNIAVECKISSAGSIRVDEILKLLELDVEKLAAPIRRTSVKWQKKTKD